MMRRILNSMYRYLRAPAARSAEEFGNEIEEEITFHIAQRAGEYMSSGMSAEEARHKALERFGNASRYAAQCHLATIRGLATWHRLHLAMTVGLILAVAWLWFRSTGRGMGSLAEFAQLPPGIASMLDNDWTGDVRGRLVDERGRPVTSAHVLVVVKTWPDQSYFQRA
ncbi:MAG TPA: permease prefix domain 1-containing protein, partial [Lacipirellulaceae bacterium]|nr:permease prefix domain 1-containing protein [Lacipirellulaceae bacterium]